MVNYLNKIIINTDDLFVRTKNITQIFVTMILKF